MFPIGCVYFSTGLLHLVYLVFFFFQFLVNKLCLNLAIFERHDFTSFIFIILHVP